MAKGIVESLEPYLAEMSEKNRYWFEMYDKELDYKQNIEEFFRYKGHNKKDFSTFELKDVQLYLEFLRERNYGANTIRPFVSQLKTFKDFLIRETTDFKKGFLYELDDLKPELGEVKSDGDALSLEELNLVKKYNKKRGTIYDNYIFEILFQLKVAKGYLPYCQPKFQDAKKEAFLFTNSLKLIVE
jgi:site-specific recombinase XerD